MLLPRDWHVPVILVVLSGMGKFKGENEIPHLPEKGSRQWSGMCVTVAGHLLADLGKAVALFGEDNPMW